MLNFKKNEVEELTIDITEFEEKEESSYDEYVEDLLINANISDYGYIDYVDDDLIRIRFEMETNKMTLEHIIKFYEKIKELVKGKLTLGIDYEHFVGDINSENISFEEIILSDFEQLS